jgi:outer membrane lipoprotein-sorting protein
MIRSLLRNYGFSLTLVSGLCVSSLGAAQSQPPGPPVPAVPPKPPGVAPAPPAPVQPAPAAAPSAPAAENADSLLKRVDGQLNAFKDAKFEFKLIIKETSGPSREVTFSTLQKGQKRLVRFLSPGDIKGMGFLIEGPESMYALLPGFNNRVRRIGTHQMNQSFMGSDVNSDDMSLVEFSPAYAPKLVGIEGENAILELNVRPGKQVAYPRVKMWVEQKRAVITRIEYNDASGKKVRTQLRENYKKDSPDGATTEHFSPGRMVFIDHVRNNHQSELILTSSQTNVGLEDKEHFTVRALQRND